MSLLYNLVNCKVACIYAVLRAWLEKMGRKRGKVAPKIGGLSSRPSNPLEAFQPIGRGLLERFKPPLKAASVARVGVGTVQTV